MLYQKNQLYFTLRIKIMPSEHVNPLKLRVIIDKLKTSVKCQWAQWAQIA